MGLDPKTFEIIVKAIEVIIEIYGKIPKQKIIEKVVAKTGFGLGIVSKAFDEYVKK